METAKKKKHDIIPHISFWRQHYALCIALAILTIIFPYSVVLKDISIDDLSTVFYPLLRWGHILNALIFYVIFPFIFLFLIVKIVKRNLSKYRNTISIQSDLIALVLLIFVGVSQCGYIAGSLITSDTYRHRDSLRINNNIYMLAHHIMFDGYLDDGALEIYQCDSMGLFCSEVFEIRHLYGGIKASELAFNETTQEISIIINGEVIYSHQLE